MLDWLEDVCGLMFWTVMWVIHVLTWGALVVIGGMFGYSATACFFDSLFDKGKKYYPAPKEAAKEAALEADAKEETLEEDASEEGNFLNDSF